jgi:hypothetical protein
MKDLLWTTRNLLCIIISAQTERKISTNITKFNLTNWGRGGRPDNNVNGIATQFWSEGQQGVAQDGEQQWWGEREVQDSRKTIAGIAE